MFRAITGRRGSGGFTILELLAVFALLAVIAALVAPKYSTVVAQSKIKACDNNVAMLAKAAEMYHEVNKEDWPDEGQLLSGEYIDEYVYCPVDVEAYYKITSGVVECGGTHTLSAE
jgi:type II secretory pathway pseudopilin PulG